jgi:NAD(P)-dependent dehydrogenase (short-subunit alcohol dehydrogenase family)
LSRPTCIVTGGSRGIGRAIAVELAQSHDCVATYRARRDAAEQLREETGCAIFPCDLASGADREALMAFARQRFAGLDLLVNNAGMAPRERRDVLEATEESFDEVLAANLKGPHFLTRLAARWMLERGSGRIVFVTSISAFAVSLNRGEYCISKAGLSMSAALWAQRLAAHGIQVFEIRPGLVRTDMIRPAEKSYDDRIAAGLLPQPRMGEPGDVAKAVRAIALGLLDYSTGQVLNVDGGFHLRSL